MAKQLVIPKPGLRVVDPATGKPLPAAGAKVEMNNYWRRRWRDDDIRLASEADAEQEQAKPARVTKTKHEG